MGPTPPLVLERCTSTATSATGRFRVGRRATTVHFDGVAPDPRSLPDAFLAIARVMGMETDQRIVCLPRPSRRFRERVDVLQRVHLSLFPQHHEAPILSWPRPDRPPLPAPDGRRTAAFFSGGVDSFALLAEHEDEIDDLLFVRGFDVPVREHARNEEVLRTVRAAAEAVGKPLIIVDTDLRDFSDPVADWTWFVYGGLIATSLLLECTHRTVLCAASVADHHLPEEAVRLRGTPFGNTRTEMRIEGRTATRVEKVAAVAASGLARDTLRVCWQNVPGTVNCGTCQKCVRTHAALVASGGAGTIATFPDELALDALAAHPAVTRSDRAYLGEIRDAADARGEADLVAALDRALEVGAPAP